MVFTGRLAARAKFIRQKKLASMDPQALREVSSHLCKWAK
jgi:hypothetical protein